MTGRLLRVFVVMACVASLVAVATATWSLSAAAEVYPQCCEYSTDCPGTSLCRSSPVCNNPDDPLYQTGGTCGPPSAPGELR
jgi:hypothetical protein